MENLTINDTNFTVSDGDELHELSVYETGFWFVIYGVIAFLAVSGNSLVIYVISTRPKMQTVTNYFIVNLAIADTLTGLVAIPFKFQAARLQSWGLPQFMCQLLPFIETVSLSVSVFTLTGSAVDRFRAIIFPDKSKMNKNVARAIISGIWICSVGGSLPYGMYHQTFAFDLPNFGWIPLNASDIANATWLTWQCLPIYNEEDWWKGYNVYLTIVQYFVPVIIVDTTYIIIGYKVWLTEPITDYSSPRGNAFERNKRRVLKMLVIVVAVFTFCWLPYETYLVLNELRPQINNFYFINVLFFCCHWLAMSNSCLNPIIYGIYNEKFQREYKRVFHRCFGHDMTKYQLPSRSNPDSAVDDIQLDSTMDSSTANNARAQSCRYYIVSELGKEEED